VKKLPTWVEVDLDNLCENLKYIKRRVGEEVGILLTVKADAYGHGGVQVGRVVEGLVDAFGVATVDEGIELKQAGITKEILVLSPILEKEIPLALDSDLSVTVSSYGFASALSTWASEAGKRARIHIEVDTGMGRTGFLLEGAGEKIVAIAKLPALEIAGLYTHFPCSESDPDFTRAQISSFLDLVRVLRETGVSIPLVHSANSAAIAFFDESHMDMVRPGLLAYGHLPKEDERVPIKPVMSWKSRLVQVRELPPGSGVSYGRTFITERKTTVGVVPVGYGHGYPFCLSNSAWMLVGGRRVPVLGRVTMDMTMVDLTDLPVKPACGDEVVLFGSQGGEYISIHELARWAGTIPYEILTGINKRVPRIFLRNGKVETFRSLLGELPRHVEV